jgi:Arc/MetJ-type ribon-helix-helix transcriptional regulator
MHKLSVKIPDDLLERLDEHVDDDPKLENRSDGVRYALWEWVNGDGNE